MVPGIKWNSRYIQPSQIQQISLIPRFFFIYARFYDLTPNKIF